MKYIALNTKNYYYFDDDVDLSALGNWCFDVFGSNLSKIDKSLKYPTHELLC